MVSEVMKEKIHLALSLIDEQQYEAAVKILRNTKTIVQEPDVYRNLDEHDKKVETEFKKRYETETKRIGEDPMVRYEKATEFINGLSEWRARATLKFYDKMSKEHDV